LGKQIEYQFVDLWLTSVNEFPIKIYADCYNFFNQSMLLGSDRTNWLLFYYQIYTVSQKKQSKLFLS